jgi:hypothetical protein
LLLATSNDATAAYVQANMSDAFVELYKRHVGHQPNEGGDRRARHALHRDHAAHVAPSRAPFSRDLMPQTDGTSELKKEQRQWQTPLADGKINFEA